MSDEQKIRELLHQYELSHVADDIMKKIEPCLRVKTTSVADDSSLKIGTSKFGGSPDLPHSVEWPYWKGNPLSFIAQLNLQNFAQSDTASLLPRSGILYFFFSITELQKNWMVGYRHNDLGAWKVIYYDAELSSLSRISAPRHTSQYRPCTLQYSHEISLPRYYKASREIWERYIEFANEVTKYYGHWELHRNIAVHKILGNPDGIQNDVLTECFLVSQGVEKGYRNFALAELPDGSSKWRLLLQVDSDENTGMTWGDAGMLYYCIPQEALQVRDFDKTWLIFHTC